MGNFNIGSGATGILTLRTDVAVYIAHRNSSCKDGDLWDTVNDHYHPPFSSCFQAVSVICERKRHYGQPENPSA